MNKIILVLGAVLLCLPAAVHADTRQEIITAELDCVEGAPTVEWSDVCYTSQRNSSAESGKGLAGFLGRDNERTKFEFGTEFFYFNYEEPGIMEDEGTFLGIFGAYTFRNALNKDITSLNDAMGDSNKANMFKVEARLDIGEVDYSSQNTGSIDGIDDWIFEIRGLAGYDFSFGGAGRITPYAGLAYRYLNDDSSGEVSSTGHFGYERESNYYYVPIGVEIYREFAAEWGATLTLEYDWFIGGKQRSHLGDAVTGLNTVENDQSEGYGLRASAKVIKYNPSFDFFVEPFVRYWDIDDSSVSTITFSGQVVGAGVEPANESIEAGLRLGIQY